MYRIHRLARYVKETSKLDGRYIPIVRAFEQKVKFEPLLGKPLSYGYLREKKFDDKRLLYLVYHDLRKILFVAVTDKRTQQAEIDFIKEHTDTYRELVETL